MSLEIIILADAEEELSEAHDHYDQQHPGLGSEFRRAVEETLVRLAEGTSVPMAVPGVDDSAIRRVFVKRFPYAVVFMAHDEACWVLAFAHHHRRPRYWRDRTK